MIESAGFVNHFVAVGNDCAAGFRFVISECCHRHKRVDAIHSVHPRTDAVEIFSLPFEETAKEKIVVEEEHVEKHKCEISSAVECFQYLFSFMKRIQCTVELVYKFF